MSDAEEDALKLQENSLDHVELNSFINGTSNISVEEYERNRQQDENEIIEADIEMLADAKYSDFEKSDNNPNSLPELPINIEESYKDKIKDEDNKEQEDNEKEEDEHNNLNLENNNIAIDEVEFKEISNTLNLALQTQINQEPTVEKTEELLKKKTDDEYEKENRKIAIENMSNKYGLTEFEVKQKIQKYVDFTRDIREFEIKKADKEFILKAVAEKKKKEEDDILTQGILKILNNVQNDIQNDNFLESIDKNSVYKNIFLNHIKTGILDYINHSDNNNEKENLDKKEIFDIFIDRYNLKISELNKNSYIGLLLQENPLSNYISLISYIFNNDLIRNEMKVFFKEIEKMDLTLDKIYYI